MGKRQKCFNKSTAEAGTELLYNFAIQTRTEYAKTQEEQANFYKMEKLAMEYAKAFYRNISISEIVLDYTDYILPIVFTSRYAAIEEAGDSKIFHQGQLSIDPMNNKRFCVRIALPIRHGKNIYLSKDLKRSIRHELIHYFLFIHDLPSDDNTALFWAYCYLFDADAYMPLSGEESAKYEKFLDALEKEDRDTPPFILSLLANAIIEEDKQAAEAYQFHINARKNKPIV